MLLQEEEDVFAVQGGQVHLVMALTAEVAFVRPLDLIVRIRGAVSRAHCIVHPTDAGGAAVQGQFPGQGVVVAQAGGDADLLDGAVSRGVCGIDDNGCLSTVPSPSMSIRKPR